MHKRIDHATHKGLRDEQKPDQFATGVSADFHHPRYKSWMLALRGLWRKITFGSCNKAGMRIFLQSKATAEAEQSMGGEVLEQSRNVLLQNGFPANRVEAVLKLNSSDPAMDIVAEAKQKGAGNIVLGRRGLSRVETPLIGGISRKVAEHSGSTTVWVVDAPLNESRKVLVAVQGLPGGRILNHYAAEHLAHLQYSKCTFMHLMPPLPPYLWDDGHILSPDERSARQSQIDQWQAVYKRQFEDVMAEGKEALVRSGLEPDNVAMRVEPTRVGIARDLRALPLFFNGCLGEAAGVRLLLYLHAV